MDDWTVFVIIGFIIGFSVGAVLYGILLYDSMCPMRLESSRYGYNRCNDALNYCKEKLAYETYEERDE